MRLRRYLKEIFGKDIKILPGKMPMKTGSDEYFSTAFKAGGETFRFAAYVVSSGMWEVVFTRDIDKGKASLEAIGDFDIKQVLEVFSGVKKSLEMFIKKYNPKTFYFTSGKDERSRTRLYRKMAKEIERKSKYKMIEDEYKDDVVFAFQKPPGVE